MNVLRTRNVHRALPVALQLLQQCGVERSSRNGPVLQSHAPVSTVYLRPLERVLFWPERDANPFFHFYESMWMLAGRCDVASLTRYVSRMKDFSDDGEAFHGAYGHRWRAAFGVDQLAGICQRLGSDPTNRREVLAMWEPLRDLGRVGKDVPCNVTATLQVSADGELNLVVFNRSNDVIWGCYGANAVHFSYLLEYCAARAGYAVGSYTQISVNWHGYRQVMDPLVARFAQVPDLLDLICPYEQGLCTPHPLKQPDTDPAAWDRGVRLLCSQGGRAPLTGQWPDPFFPDVALPIVAAHDAYKDTQGEERFEQALRIAESCRASDWRTACTEWVTRRWKQHNREIDDGPSA